MDETILPSDWFVEALVAPMDGGKFKTPDGVLAVFEPNGAYLVIHLPWSYSGDELETHLLISMQ